MSQDVGTGLGSKSCKGGGVFRWNKGYVQNLTQS